MKTSRDWDFESSLVQCLAAQMHCEPRGCSAFSPLLVSAFLHFFSKSQVSTQTAKPPAPTMITTDGIATRTRSKTKQIVTTVSTTAPASMSREDSVIWLLPEDCCTRRRSPRRRSFIRRYLFRFRFFSVHPHRDDQARHTSGHNHGAYV
ncbi:hypothetical protein K402DRAFT_265832 [Aulographum hederae CBS 113979]|uniref:Uncharacterized protein n=1 Tax=Aulographum hederae CBS 113979 TaxID=1176131 RepID=A0A6G1GIM5_9PEZI|nr:hypothetical protein K402DRAFT_265832 [Aulographum hederae CBS 113979]